MQHTLLHCLVQGGDSLPKNLLSALLVALNQRLAQLAQGAAQPGSVGAVANRTFFGLDGHVFSAEK